MKNATGKMLKTILSLVMVLSLLVGCSLMFVGCNDSSEDEKPGTGDNRNDPAQYEGLEKEEYLQKLESNNMGAAVDALGSAYDKLMGGFGGSSSTANGGGKVNMTLTVGDSVISLLEQSIDGGADLSFLSSVNITMDAGISGDLEKIALTAGLNGKDIATLNMLMSMSDSIMYICVPELNDQWIKFDMSAVLPTMGDAAAEAQIATILKALPDGDTLTSILNRYLEMILEELDNVDQSTVTLEVNGVKQTCTALDLKIYEEDAQRIVKKVLTALKDDAEVKKIIEDVANAVEDATGENIGADAAYGDFLDGINEGLTAIEEDEEYDTENYINLITYVDNAHNIIGRALTVEGGARSGLYYYTVTSGNQFAFEAALLDTQSTTTEAAKVVGSGTTNGGKTNGTFDVSVEDVKMLTLEIADMDDNSGTLTLKPSADLLSEVGLGMIAEPALQIKIEKEKVAMNLTAAGELLLGISMSVTESNGPALSVPSNPADMTDSSAMDAWSSAITMDELLDNLRSAGAGDLVDLVEQLLYAKSAPAINNNVMIA